MSSDPYQNKPVSKLVPKAPIHRLTAPIRRFLHIEAASGFVLMICTVIALALANSSYGKEVHDFWEQHLAISLGDWKLDYSLHFWINDALMAIFFFVVGLEIKREIVAGELSSPKKAALPIIGALGGMVIPALIYLAFSHEGDGKRGWAIPMATDIAFVVGVMAAFGRRVPFGLKIFLLSLAIADDMGAVLVIALVYTEKVNMIALAIAALGFGITYLFNRLGIRTVGIYVVVGSFIWIAVLASGVHPTVAGVLLGLLTPSSAWIGKQSVIEAIQSLSSRITVESGNAESDTTPLDTDEVKDLEFAIRESASPLARLETQLHPWVSFFIMPIFALANAGVEIKLDALGEKIPMAIATGLVLGKSLGIFGLCFIALKIGLGKLPKGVNYLMLLAASFLGGIGFTMALFVAGLAFINHPEMLEPAKAGIMLGSTISALIGATLLWLSFPKSHSSAT